jgi:mannose-6-phosphate isomerase-like protein (cupin superfamily)
MIKHPGEMLYRERQIRGGNGECQTLDLLMEEEMRHCRVFTKFTLQKGVSIGEHIHDKETEYYWILSGKGVVTEVDGDKLVGPGDLVITGNGASHAIRNEQDEPLEFLALIILD